MTGRSFLLGPGVALLVIGGASTSARAVQATEEAAPARFFIEAYDVIGNTLLDSVTVERAIYPYLGPDRSIEDVNKARDALESAYRAKGYQAVSVSVLGTTENDTVVQFQVVEAKVGTLKVTGAEHFSEAEILKQVPALKPGEVPNLTQAQAQLARLDRNADRRVTPNVQIGQQPGTIDVTLEVEDEWPYHGSVSLTNDHSPNTSELRLLTQVRATNLWQKGHSFSFSYLVAPERRADAEVFAGSYLVPVYNSPWSILVYGYKSNSDVALLGGSNVLGDGYAIGLRGVLALPSAGNWSQSLNFGVDYKDFNEDTFIPDTDPIPAPVRYMPAAVSYSAQRVGDRSTLAVTLGLTAGLRIFNETVNVGETPDGVQIDEPVFANRRAGSRENFVHANLDVDWSRTLTDDTRIAGRLSAQYADGPLISNEQFSAGGMTSVRGYLQSEAVGDDGVSGQFEVALPSVASKLGKKVQDLRPYFFLDAGFARNRAISDPGQDNNFTLLSAGAGARAQLFNFLTGDVLIGVPFLEGTSSREGKATVYFTVKGEF